jgi:hypothetical protein
MLPIVANDRLPIQRSLNQSAEVLHCVLRTKKNAPNGGAQCVARLLGEEPHNHSKQSADNAAAGNDSRSFPSKNKSDESENWA